MRQHGNPPLLYKETFPDKLQAAAREKAVKGYSRNKKQALVAKLNA